MPRIACLHTAESNIVVFEAAGRGLGLDGLMLQHEVWPDLLTEAEKAGGLTPEISHRTTEALLALSKQADAVVLTCSTLGPCIDAISQNPAAVPMLRVDAALACEAVRFGGDVVVLCAVETTLAPTRILFEQAALETGAKVEVRLVPGAWDLFKAGDREQYLVRTAEVADEAMRNGASRVALAQASMAEAAKLVKIGPPPLTSPATGLQAAVAAAVRTGAL